MFYGPECGLARWIIHVSLRRVCILLLLDGIFYKCPVYLVDQWCHWVQQCPYWFSARWVFSYNSRFLVFSLQFYRVLPYVAWWPVVRNVHIKDCYVFVENWSLYHYVSLCFIPDNFPFFEVYSVWNKYRYSCFLKS